MGFGHGEKLMLSEVGIRPAFVIRMIMAHAGSLLLFP
jgi:hypothetical protein